MKKIHLILCLLMGTTFLSAQCDELFISEYVEGGFNNKALEIYNPTNTAVDLSEYMIGRYRNGTLIFDGVQLPPIMLESYDVFVAVIDKRNPEGTCLEDPIWNGYVLLDTIEAPLGPEYNLIFSADTCADGETILASIAAGPTYYEEFDLEGKADGFFSPIYDENGAMYWNGNDAVVLIKGTEVNADFSNVIDVVGVIGEDPGGNGWRDSSFVNMSKDATITKNAFITHGSVQTADEGDAYLGDFNYWEWVAHPKYTFSNLGSHECICDENVAGVVSSIEVQVFYDFIANGVYDEGEEPLNNQSVSINPAALTEIGRAHV